MPTQMSSIPTPRFSDEFYLSHLGPVKEEERGSTTNLTIINPDKLFFPGKERLKT
jgi:hypothetical protein